MRAVTARSRASASEPAGARSPPIAAASFLVVDSGWATLQLSR